MIRRPQGNISPLWLIVILLAFIAILYQTNYMYATIEKRVKSWLQLEDVSLAEGISHAQKNDTSEVLKILEMIFCFSCESARTFEAKLWRSLPTEGGNT